MGQILKPCPFCGDTTAVFLVGFHVKCDKCSALGPYDGVSRLAIAAWNTRAPDADHLEELAAKDEQIRQLREALARYRMKKGPRDHRDCEDTLPCDNRCYLCKAADELLEAK